MGEDPLGDRDAGDGQYTAHQGDDPASSLDDLASTIQDRDDADVDTDGSLADLADEVASADTPDAPGGASNVSGSRSGDPGGRSGLDADGYPLGQADDPLSSLGSGGSSDGVSSQGIGSGPSSRAESGAPFGSATPAFGAAGAASAGGGPRDPATILAELDAEREDPVSPAVVGRGGSNVLVLGPVSGCERECVEHLSEDASIEVNALFVSASQSVDQRLDAWQQHAGGYPANAALVTLGGRSRSGGSSAVIETQAGPDRITVDAVSDPADLTRLGITLTRRLEEWETNPYPTVLCLHSLTELLQYVELRRLFRFVHVLQNSLERVDGLAHYHLDPNAHDERTVRLFQTLVDESRRLTDEQ